MLFTIAPASDLKEFDVYGQYNIWAYQPTDDCWFILKRPECELCWSIPSIVGLPSGRLLILDVTPDSPHCQFNVLEVVAKGKHGKSGNININLRRPKEGDILEHNNITLMHN